MKVLEKVVIFSLDVTIWTARKKLRPEDLKLGDGGELPPEEVASLGSKRVMDPERLNPFYKLKKQMERTLEAVGFRFLGGYALPDDKLSSISKLLDDAVGEFMEERRKFLAEYDQALEDWVLKHPRFEPALRRAVMSSGDVANRIGASYTAYRVQGADDNGSLDREVSRMGDQLLSEVANAANDLYENSIASRTDQSINRRILSPLMRLRNKLGGLAFLDGAILPMVTTIDDLVRRLPVEGLIEGAFYHELVATILLLCDPSKMRAHAAARSSVTGLSSMFFEAAPRNTDEGDAGATAGVGQATTGQSSGDDLFEGLFQEPTETPATPGTAPAPAEESEGAPEPVSTGKDAQQTEEPPLELPAATEAEVETEVLEEDPGLDDEAAETLSDHDGEPVLVPPCDSGKIVENFWF